jgi:hypothetical protein
MINSSHQLSMGMGKARKEALSISTSNLFNAATLPIHIDHTHLPAYHQKNSILEGR